MCNEYFMDHVYDGSGVTCGNLFGATHAPQEDGYKLWAHSIIIPIGVIEHDSYVDFIEIGYVCGELADNHGIVCAPPLSSSMCLRAVDATGIRMAHESTTEEYF